jgi:hypothetical protein
VQANGLGLDPGAYMVLATLLLTTASVVAVADLIGQQTPNQNVNPQPNPGPGPGPGPGCNCPAVWQPVQCKGEDGRRYCFSNGCVAGCEGFTKCERIDVEQCF